MNGYTAHRPTDVSERSIFFYLWAPYSYDPKVETEEEGRLRTSLGLARAEMWAEEVGAEFDWAPDDAFRNHRDDQPETCERVLMWVEDESIASLWCVDDATAATRRIVNAQLALEAKARLPEQVIGEWDW